MGTVSQQPKGPKHGRTLGSLGKVDSRVSEMPPSPHWCASILQVDWNYYAACKGALPGTPLHQRGEAFHRGVQMFPSHRGEGSELLGLSGALVSPASVEKQPSLPRSHLQMDIAQ